MADRTHCSPKPIPGRPSKLSAEELSWIANAVRDHNPQQFKFEFGLWTLSLIRHLIKRQFKKELSVSSVHRLMKILGFSARSRSTRRGSKTPSWCARETETYPRFALKPSGSGATIYFGDESGIRSDYPHRHDLGATRPDAGGAGDGPALLAEHDLGRRHAGANFGSCCMRDRSVRKCSSSSSSA